MQKIKTSILFLIIFFVINFSFAQSRIDNQLLIQFEDNITPKSTIQLLRRTLGLNGKIHSSHVTEVPLNIWKLEFENSNVLLEEIFQFLINIDEIEKVQYNHNVENRNIPNDPKFVNQWAMKNIGQNGGAIDADIDADLAWDLTTGGVTPNGDTIVICIIDNGVDFDHEDLTDNLWINHNEIPDNGIDDDGNGYIDDFYGWNTVLENDDVDGGSHGTSVAGIIGAKGNNSKGIAGINWDVKLLIIMNGNDEANVFSAYSYAYNMRKLYNETNGEKGAFIVSTNSSFGIDKDKPEDHPIWCSFYDLLGSVGIINIGATTNLNTDVDIFGDIPSTCPSDYLISVTNIDKYNQKETAGYGSINVDIGAYGESTYTTKPGNSYGSFYSTSAATPHVTGVTGLLYAHSLSLSNMALTHPQHSALLVKDAILNSVVPNQSIVGITVTEGVVNAYNSLKRMEKYDSNCAIPSQINFDSIGGEEIVISWDDYNSDFQYNIIMKSEGEEWTLIEDLSSPFVINDLLFCTKYSFKIQKICDGIIGDFGYEFYAKTDGCCDVPKIIDYSLDSNSIHLEWKDVLIANNYEVKFKYWSHPVWNTLTTENNFIDLENNYNCGKYIFSIQSLCENVVSNFSKDKLFGLDCEACTELEYCNPKMDNTLEWIDSFSISSFTYKSGRDFGGKGDFSHSRSIRLVKNEIYQTSFHIRFDDTVYDDFIYIWIDFNRDGLFSIDEMVVNMKNDNKEIIIAEIKIPDTIIVGETRMRVMLSYKEKEDPCDIDEEDYGEYEDYCIVLDTVSNCNIADVVLDTVEINNLDALFNWNNIMGFDGIFYTYRNPEVTDKWETGGYTSDSIFKVVGLEKCTEYELQCGVYCTPIEMKLLDILTFKTSCIDATFDLFENDFLIYPNPFSNILTISSNVESTDVEVVIIDIFGNKIFDQELNNLSSAKIVMDNNFKPGIYFVKIKHDKRVFIQKIMKQ